MIVIKTILMWILLGVLILGAIFSAVLSILSLHHSWFYYMALEEASSNPNTRAEVIKKIVVHVIATIIYGGLTVVLGYLFSVFV